MTITGQFVEDNANTWEPLCINNYKVLETITHSSYEGPVLYNIYRNDGTITTGATSEEVADFINKTSHQV